MYSPMVSSLGLKTTVHSWFNSKGHISSYIKHGDILESHTYLNPILLKKLINPTQKCISPYNHKLRWPVLSQNCMTNWYLTIQLRNDTMRISRITPYSLLATCIQLLVGILAKEIHIYPSNQCEVKASRRQINIKKLVNQIALPKFSLWVTVSTNSIDLSWAFGVYKNNFYY